MAQYHYSYCLLWYWLHQFVLNWFLLVVMVAASFAYFGSKKSESDPKKAEIWFGKNSKIIAGMFSTWIVFSPNLKMSRVPPPTAGPSPKQLLHPQVHNSATKARHTNLDIAKPNLHYTPDHPAAKHSKNIDLSPTYSHYRNPTTTKNNPNPRPQLLPTSEATPRPNLILLAPIRSSPPYQIQHHCARALTPDPNTHWDKAIPLISKFTSFNHYSPKQFLHPQVHNSATKARHTNLDIAKPIYTTPRSSCREIFQEHRPQPHLQPLP